MKKIIITSVIAFIAFHVNAQTISVATGKKIQAVVNEKINTTVSQMGQEMEIPSTFDIYFEYVIKAVDGKKVTLTATNKRIKISVSVMGNDQKIDSDDSATRSNPQMAEAFKDVNKPVDITVEAGKSANSTDLNGTATSEDVAAVLFFPFKSGAKEGESFSDSTTKADGSKMVNVYTITKSTKDELTVTQTNNSKLSGTKQQMGMEIQVNMNASYTAIRVYDIATGLLKSETKTSTASGTNEVQGMSIPVTMKGTATTSIQ